MSTMVLIDSRFGSASFGFLWSFGIRHSSFVIVVFAEINFEKRFHLLQAVPLDRICGDARETVESDQGVQAGVLRVDAEQAPAKTLVDQADILVNPHELFQL